ncbi:hypothetical protein HPP92_014470 [Vanilla planifolia]|uniref:Uncharacterized protein n=1 Tax=Vanilla planifolia TaxID=51239 RepID=A0A835QLH0_VANPL|nr:hypothetical protein HPP92_014470 [Vanilla planifolia]
MKAEKILWQITNEDMTNGYTIVSALNFKYLALSVSLSNLVKRNLDLLKSCSLGDMDGSIDLYAYDADGNSMRIFIFSKHRLHEAVPTKVRPFMAFTNRLGEDLFIILNSEDQLKILHASDARVAFMEPARGPIRIENRMADRTLEICQSGLADDDWIKLEPLSSTNFFGMILLEMQSGTFPLELIIELGIVGFLIDHKPRELLYLYLEKVFASFSTGYDAGKTSRFKLIVGKLQLDNQLFDNYASSISTEDMPDLNHPVLCLTVTLSNDNIDVKDLQNFSTDRQFLQLRSKQVWSRRITGFSDGFSTVPKLHKVQLLEDTTEEH